MKYSHFSFLANQALVEVVACCALFCSFYAVANAPDLIPIEVLILKLVILAIPWFWKFYPLENYYCW